MGKLVAYLRTEYRQERGLPALSQSGLARMCELDPSFINRVESGERMPERGTIEAMATVLRVSGYHRTRLYHLAGYLTPEEWEQE